MIIKTKYENETMKRRDCHFPDSLWNALADQARTVSIELGKTVSRSDLVRQGSEMILKKLNRR